MTRYRGSPRASQANMPSAQTEDIARTVAEESWRLFPHTFAQVVSGGKWLPYRHAVYAARIVGQAIHKGGALVIINMPPRHSKSITFSQWLPAWHMDLWPHRHMIATAYSESLASDWGMKVRDILDGSPLCRTKIRQDASKKTHWITDQGGGMITTGIGGSITGHGAHLLILDDPYKNEEEASSPTIRRHVTEWFESTLLTRAEPNASVIVIMTRWNQNDLTAHLLAERPGAWTHINMPAIAEGPDEIGRNAGDPLCPERFDIAALSEIRRRVGSRVWQGLYQQNPTPGGGTVFKRHWWRYWHPAGTSVLPVTEKTDDGDVIEIPAVPIPSWDRAQIHQSWDLSFDETPGAAYVCGQVWALLPNRPGDRFLIDQIRERMDIVKTIAAIKSMRAKWPRTAATYIEKKANGAAVLTMLGRVIPGLIPVEPKGSKEFRGQAVAPTVEAGNAFVPHPSLYTWVTPFLDEAAAFPSGRYADQVDTMSQVLVQLNGRRAASSGSSNDRTKGNKDAAHFLEY